MPASALPTVVDMSTDFENEVPQLRGNRFAALGESQEGRDGNRRRLVLISQRADARDRERYRVHGGCIRCGSQVEPTVAENPVVLKARVRAPVRAFASLDAVNLVTCSIPLPPPFRSFCVYLLGEFSWNFGGV